MGYLRLLKTHPQALCFGFLNSFFSGLGQTHFISIFSPLLMARFTLNNTQYGTLYSLVTLASGLLIPFIGPYIDKKDIRFFSLFLGFGLIFSQFLLIHTHTLAVVALALFGLRLFGQGLCSSVSSIVIARYFTTERGKALSLTFLGFPLYEGFITPLFAILLTVLSFQNIGYILIIAVLFIYIPLTLSLTRNIPSFNKPSIEEKTSSLSDIPATTHWSRKQVFSKKTIYLLLPQTLMPPFALTGLLFHQAAIGDMKGWSLSLMASSLIFFALGRSITTFTAGPIVDKFSAKQLFPFYQVPLCLGFLIMAIGSAQWVPALAFSLFGLAVGSGGPIKAAIWAELYGTKHLGAIKSALATIMVMSTAASPALFGWLLDTLGEPKSLLHALVIASITAAVLAYLSLRNEDTSI